MPYRPPYRHSNPWRINNGYLCRGVTRYGRMDYDSDPAPERKAEIENGIVTALNYHDELVDQILELGRELDAVREQHLDHWTEDGRKEPTEGQARCLGVWREKIERAQRLFEEVREAERMDASGEAGR